MARAQTVSFSYQRTLIDALLAALNARPAAALLTTPTIRLCTSAVDPGGVTTLASITECTFNGYTAVVLGAAIGPVNVPTLGRALLYDADFVAGAAIVAPGEVVTGYYLTDSPNPATLLFGGELFATPIPIVNPGDALAIDVLLPLLLGEATGFTQ